MHCTFHCVFSLCNFHVCIYQSHSKANGVNQTILLCFVKKVDDPSVQRTNCNSWKWRTRYFEWHNIHSISKLGVFSLRYTSKQGLLRCRQIIQKIPVMELTFLTMLETGGLQLYKKMYSLASVFQSFCPDLLLSIKSFIPTKTIYSETNIRV